MTRDEIIDLANNAGINFQRHTGPLVRVNISTCGSQSIEKVERFAALVAAAEREACAKLCEARYMGDNNREDAEAKRCAAAIRARGEFNAP